MSGWGTHEGGRSAIGPSSSWLLSTGLRREELVTLDLGQVQPNEPKRLRTARLVRVRGVKGQGRDRA